MIDTPTDVIEVWLKNQVAQSVPKLIANFVRSADIALIPDGICIIFPTIERVILCQQSMSCLFTEFNVVLIAEGRAIALDGKPVNIQDLQIG